MNHRSMWGSTPLHNAVQSVGVEMRSMCEPNVVVLMVWPPCFFVHQGRIECAKMLLEKGGDPNIMTKDVR